MNLNTYVILVNSTFTILLFLGNIQKFHLQYPQNEFSFFILMVNFFQIGQEDKSNMFDHLHNYYSRVFISLYNDIHV
jgi:hypothetical protein